MSIGHVEFRTVSFGVFVLFIRNPYNSIRCSLQWDYGYMANFVSA